MKILMTGATGFVGQKLALRLFREGHDLVILTRNSKKAQEVLGLPATYVQWDIEKTPAAVDTFVDLDGVIHLAGESISGKRWNRKRKEQIYNSRILSTQNLVTNIRSLEANTLKFFITASAVGIFGDRGDEILTEDSKPGDDFLSHVCVDWESEAQKASSFTRVANLRLGVVLGEDGGALKEMVPPFTMGLGAKLGSGKQWMSWVHLEDVIDAFVFAVTHELTGPVNVVAPEPVTNSEFTKTLARALDTVAWATAPGPVLKILFGEMAKFILDSLRVVPTKLLAAGFKYKYPVLLEALKQACHDVPNEHLVATQFIARPKEEVFEFFADAKNLEDITPPWLNFKVLKQSTAKIGKGTEIDYRLKVHGVPLGWKTKIEAWNANQNFIDNQLKGPYKRWHHTHTFDSLRGGTLMQDRVSYRLPVGPLGRLVGGRFVKKDVEGIFLFRKKKILEIFK